MMMKNSSVVAMLVTEATVVVIALLVAFGVNLSADQVAAITGAAGFVGLVLTLVLWAFTVDRKKVLEKLVGDQVVAGEANDMVPAGTEVRTIGDTGDYGRQDFYGGDF